MPVFEVDGWTDEGGWSVMVKGIAERITDEDELARARKAPVAVDSHREDDLRAGHPDDRHQRTPFRLRPRTKAGPISVVDHQASPVGMK